jgi:hypothetical protein
VGLARASWNSALVVVSSPWGDWKRQEWKARREKVDGELAAMDGGGGMMADGTSSWEQGREEKNMGERWRGLS